MNDHNDLFNIASFRRGAVWELLLIGLSVPEIADQMGLQEQEAQHIIDEVEQEYLNHQRNNDFCRTCKGKGTLSEPSDRPGVIVTSTCWACNGTRYGR